MALGVRRQCPCARCEAHSTHHISANTYCRITAVYDQSNKRNDLVQAPRGGFSGPAMGGFKNLALAPTTLMDHKACGVFIEPRHGPPPERREGRRGRCIQRTWPAAGIGERLRRNACGHLSAVARPEPPSGRCPLRTSRLTFAAKGTWSSSEEHARRRLWSFAIRETSTVAGSQRYFQTSKVQISTGTHAARAFGAGQTSP